MQTNGAQSSKKKKRSPVDRVERWPLTKLVPYARNPRLHSPEQIDQIAASMTEFGQAQLIVVNPKGQIIAGHGRVLAAEQLGWKELTVGIATNWTEAQSRAYRIADNKLALTSMWDDEMLKMELQELQVSEFDLRLMGFDAKELGTLFKDPEALSNAAQLEGLAYAVIVRCENEQDQIKTLNDLIERGLKCEALIS